MFKTAAAADCFLGLVFCMLEKLAPTEKYSKQPNLIFSLVLALTVLQPFLGEDGVEITLFDENTSEPLEEIDLQIEYMAAENVSDVLMDYLMENGINPIKISTEINNLEDGSIFIIAIIKNAVSSLTHGTIP